jgi:hypothetical protein
MADFRIPCDTVARLANVVAGLSDEIEPVFKCIRFDNGVAVTTDRSFMAIEKIGDFTGIFHMIVETTLIEQCRVESAFNGYLTITENESLKYAVGKTSLGYIHPNNVGFYPTSVTPFDRWRDVVLQSKEPASEAVGGMFWNVDGLVKLATSSPSGRVVFEEHIDTKRPSLIRDVYDHGWLGVFNPFTVEKSYQPASLPSWMVA